MEKIVKVLAGFVTLAAMQMTAIAAPIVDQNNPDKAYGFCYTDPGALCGQSFQQTHATISGAGFLVDSSYGGSDGTVTISIYSKYGNTPSGLIASGTSSVVNGNSGWVDVFFAPAAVTAGQEYYLVIASMNHLVAAYSTANYAVGNAIIFGSSIDYSSYDLVFRTYSDDAAGTVPEPTSIALMGLGLAAAGLFGRRRKA